MVRRIVVGTASSSSTSRRQLPPLFFTVSGLINRAPLKAKYPKNRGYYPATYTVGMSWVVGGGSIRGVPRYAMNYAIRNGPYSQKSIH